MAVRSARIQYDGYGGAGQWEWTVFAFDGTTISAYITGAPNTGYIVWCGPAQERERLFETLDDAKRFALGQD